MGGKGASMRPIDTSPIAIKTLSVVVKGRVADILGPYSMSSIITPTITSYVVMNTIIDVMIINR